MLLVMLAFGTLGLCVGSFLNVVILRQGTGAFSGRSSCMSCAKTLAWYDLVPIASWVFLRGRCRACDSSISIQYPLVEGATAILFAFFGTWVLWP
jgi:leader peptidase (prepilin peptidase)/N-methyltransferase